jgi:1-deoxy-D-xylulose-5-phosphate reductoisomerase
MKKIAILGSTGSIGVNTLDVIERSPGEFQAVALAAGSNIEIFAEQIRKFKPRIVSLRDTGKLAALKELLKGQKVEIHAGDEGSLAVATAAEADVVVSGMVGSAGLVPTLAAIRAGKTIALANKETLVVAGELVLKAAAGKVNIIPVDSEHSAIFQALNGEKRERVKRIILTGSGGPFRTRTREQMQHVTVKEALNHPNWKMGDKITIDSATMMNKGLEYIEAKWLFGRTTPVDILIHPQSIIHSMVEFVDTSIMAQLGMPDMRVPIAYALTYPDRLAADLPSLDLARLGTLTFQEPDFEKFPCLQLAHEAMDSGQTYPAVLNAANEIAVRAFLDEAVPFKDIAMIIRATLHKHKPAPVNDLEDVLEADRWARQEAKNWISVSVR